MKIRFNKAGGDFSEGSIPSNILSLAIPLIIADLVNVLYNLVDRMYLGHIPGTGTLALTSVGLSLPVITLITAFASLVGYGGAPLFSIARGEKNDGQAKTIMETSFLLLLGTSLLLMVLLFVFARPVLLLIGADDTTLSCALEYLRVYLIGTPFVLVTLGMNPFINAQGYAKTAMFTTLLGGILNILLDPVFIYLFGLGVKGAAIATVISQLCSSVWVCRFLLGPVSPVRLERLHLDLKEAGRILALGISGFAFKVTNSITQAVANAMLNVYGGDMSLLFVGSLSIIHSLREVSTQPVSGLTNAAQPVMSYNYGAGEYKRVRDCIKFVFLSAMGCNLVFWALLQFFPETFIRIFASDPDLIRTCVPCLKIYFGVYFMMTLQLTGQNTYVATNKPKFSVFFSLFRKFVLVLPLTLLLPRTSMGVYGVFYAELISQMIGASACFITMMLTVWRELKQKEKIVNSTKPPTDAASAVL